MKHNWTDENGFFFSIAVERDAEGYWVDKWDHKTRLDVATRRRRFFKWLRKLIRIATT